MANCDNINSILIELIYSFSDKSVTLSEYKNNPPNLAFTYFKLSKDKKTIVGVEHISSEIILTNFSNNSWRATKLFTPNSRKFVEDNYQQKINTKWFYNVVVSYIGNSKFETTSRKTYDAPNFQPSCLVPLVDTLNFQTEEIKDDPIKANPYELTMSQLLYNYGIMTMKAGSRIPKSLMPKLREAYINMSKNPVQLSLLQPTRRTEIKFSPTDLLNDNIIPFFLEQDDHLINSLSSIVDMFEYVSYTYLPVDIFFQVIRAGVNAVYNRYKPKNRGQIVQISLLYNDVDSPMTELAQVFSGLSENFLEDFVFDNIPLTFKQYLAAHGSDTKANIAQNMKLNTKLFKFQLVSVVKSAGARKTVTKKEFGIPVSSVTVENHGRRPRDMHNDWGEFVDLFSSNKNACVIVSLNYYFVNINKQQSSNSIVNMMRNGKPQYYPVIWRKLDEALNLEHKPEETVTFDTIERYASYLGIRVVILNDLDAKIILDTNENTTKAPICFLLYIGHISGHVSNVVNITDIVKVHKANPEYPISFFFEIYKIYPDNNQASFTRLNTILNGPSKEIIIQNYLQAKFPDEVKRVGYSFLDPPGLGDVSPEANIARRLNAKYLELLSWSEIIPNDRLGEALIKLDSPDQEVPVEEKQPDEKPVEEKQSTTDHYLLFFDLETINSTQIGRYMDVVPYYIGFAIDNEPVVVRQSPEPSLSLIGQMESYLHNFLVNKAKSKKGKFRPKVSLIAWNGSKFDFPIVQKYFFDKGITNITRTKKTDLNGSFLLNSFNYQPNPNSTDQETISYVIHFWDPCKFIMSSLADAAKSFGNEITKGDLDHNAVQTEYQIHGNLNKFLQVMGDKVKDYQVRDVEAEREIVTKFINVTKSWGYDTFKFVSISQLSSKMCNNIYKEGCKWATTKLTYLLDEINYRSKINRTEYPNLVKTIEFFRDRYTPTSEIIKGKYARVYIDKLLTLEGPAMGYVIGGLRATQANYTPEDPEFHPDQPPIKKEESKPIYCERFDPEKGDPELDMDLLVLCNVLKDPEPWKTYQDSVKDTLFGIEGSSQFRREMADEIDRRTMIAGRVQGEVGHWVFDPVTMSSHPSRLSNEPVISQQGKVINQGRTYLIDVVSLYPYNMLNLSIPLMSEKEDLFNLIDLQRKCGIKTASEVARSSLPVTANHFLKKLFNFCQFRIGVCRARIDQSHIKGVCGNNLFPNRNKTNEFTYVDGYGQVRESKIKRPTLRVNFNTVDSDQLIEKDCKGYDWQHNEVIEDFFCTIDIIVFIYANIMLGFEPQRGLNFIKFTNPYGRGEYGYCFRSVRGYYDRFLVAMLEGKKRSKGAERMVYKLCANSASGKPAQKSYDTKSIISKVGEKEGKLKEAFEHYYSCIKAMRSMRECILDYLKFGISDCKEPDFVQCVKLFKDYQPRSVEALTITDQKLHEILLKHPGYRSCAGVKPPKLNFETGKYTSYEIASRINFSPSLISSVIYATSRGYMFTTVYMRGYRVTYSDTDSIMCGEECVGFLNSVGLIGNDIGQFEIEIGNIVESIVVGPKSYMVTYSDTYNKVIKESDFHYKYRFKGVCMDRDWFGYLVDANGEVGSNVCDIVNYDTSRDIMNKQTIKGNERSFYLRVLGGESIGVETTQFLRKFGGTVNANRIKAI